MHVRSNEIVGRAWRKARCSFGGKPFGGKFAQGLKLFCGESAKKKKRVQLARVLRWPSSWQLLQKEIAFLKKFEKEKGFQKAHQKLKKKRDLVLGNEGVSHNSW